MYKHLMKGIEKVCGSRSEGVSSGLAPGKVDWLAFICAQFLTDHQGLAGRFNEPTTLTRDSIS